MREHRQAYYFCGSRPHESREQRLIRHNLWLSAVVFVRMVVWSYVVQRAARVKDATESV